MEGDERIYNIKTEIDKIDGEIKSRADDESVPIRITDKHGETKCMRATVHAFKQLQVSLVKKMISLLFYNYLYENEHKNNEDEFIRYVTDRYDMVRIIRNEYGLIDWENTLNVPIDSALLKREFEMYQSQSSSNNEEKAPTRVRF